MELDREALLIYLGDLRIMETILHEDDNKIKAINEKDKSLKLECASFVKEEPNMPKESITESGHSIALGIFSLVISILFFRLASAGNSSYIIAGVGFLIVFLCVAGLYISSKIKNAKDYEADMEIYERKISKYKIKYEKMQKAYRKYQDNAANCISEIGSEKREISEQLQKAYNANIIPLQFRNIQGIYYLYDYISTSNQGLSEALMQCNLEAIKARLDNVIRIQGTAIVKQAQANAALYRQNQEILATAQATMNNTAMAAKYAAISAANSTLALKLQTKDLAYQRADFWLK